MEAVNLIKTKRKTLLKLEGNNREEASKTEQPAMISAREGHKKGTN
jgi:hypothetical protein